VVRLPLVLPALALVAGIAAGLLAPMTTGFWVVLGIAALLVAGVTFTRPHLHLASLIAALVTVAAVGAVHLREAHYTAGPDHVATFTPRHSMPVTLRGRVVTAPKIYRGGSLPGYRRSDRTTLIVSAQSILTGDRWRDISGLVRVTVDGPLDSISPGQEIQLVGRIGRFGRPNNPGQMDWSQFARRTRVFVQMSVPAASGATVLPGGSPSWPMRAIWHLRAAARQHLLACGDAREGHLLNALILGERDPALRSLNQAMATAGIAHFLSISGLHVGMFLGFVYFLCRLLQLGPRRSAMAVLVVLGLYVLLAEPRAPLLRSAIMAAALCISVITHRRYAALNALAAAAIVLLMVDPLQVLSPGFQLSFTIVGGLIVLYRPVRGLLFGRWLRRRGLMVFRNEQRVRRWMWFSLGDAATGMVALCVSAYLVAAPLIACHFGLFSPYAPVLSIVFFPLVLAVLVPGYLAIALAWPMPNLAGSIRQIALGAAELLDGAVWTTQHLPGLSFPLRPVGAIWTLMCYATLALLCFGWRFRIGRRAAVVMLLVTTALGVYTQRTAPTPAPGTAELDLLAVGKGQCAILRTSSGRTWLIDAGTQSGFDVWDQVLGPFLRTRRLETPTGAFISHANTDHFNALFGLLNDRGLETAYLNEHFGKIESLLEGEKKMPEAEEKMIDALADSRTEIVRLRAGSGMQLDPHTHVEVLWPPAWTPSASKPPDLSRNDRSLVLRVTCGGKSVLLAGDLSQKGQARLLAEGADLRADVLVLPHHGAWTESLSEFFAAVSPQVVLLSASLGLDRYSSRNPARDAFINTLRQSRRYYTTPRNGWIHLTFGGEGTIRIETMRR